MQRVNVEAEIPRSHGVPHQVQLRMQGIAGSGLQVKLLFSRQAGAGTHGHQVGIKLVGALVGGALHAVVKVQVEFEHGIRQGLQLGRFLDSRGLAGVHASNLHHRVQVLGVGGSGSEQEGRYDEFFFHG